MLLVRYGATDPIRRRLCLTAYPVFPPQAAWLVSLDSDTAAVLSVSGYRDDKDRRAS